MGYCLDNIRLGCNFVNMMKRQTYEAIWKKLEKYKQMVFISGPRQAGKTTFSKMIGEQYANSLYFNWDITDEKKKVIENPFFYEHVQLKDDSKPLIILDELHKYPDWKNYLKGIYDRDKENYKFIVSGSGRLKVFQKGGDSLAGRYLLFYLWPFTLAEIAGRSTSMEDFIENPLQIPEENHESLEIWETLEMCSGFPDPFVEGEASFYNIWSNTYKKQMLREDIRDWAALKNAEQVELLFSLLPSKVGSPLSMASISRDIQASFDSVKKWIGLMEHFFMVFRIPPWVPKISRAITKENKLYLFDYAGIESSASKFENMIALELWRAVTNWNNLGLGDYTLHYLRNREKEEVDFLLARNNQPQLLIEAKLSDGNPSKSLIKFQNILNVPAVQLVNKKGICKKISNQKNQLLIINASRWLTILP